jgi:hypothetical protein
MCAKLPDRPVVERSVARSDVPAYRRRGFGFKAIAA